MDPDAPWQGSQEAAARKAVETTDAAWPTEAKSFRSYCLARKRSEKAKVRAGASPRAATLHSPPGVAGRACVNVPVLTNSPARSGSQPSAPVPLRGVPSP